jgi:DNA ligase-1
LYSDSLTFQELVGLVKRVTLKPGDADKMRTIKLRVYDSYDPSNPHLDFADRAIFLHGRKQLLPLHYELVENFTAHNEDDIYRLQRQFVSEGYEGAMVRNRKGAYGLNKRSADLQKVKTFLDGEYKIVGFTEGEGGETGCVVWKCETAGQIFNVRPQGTREQRREAFKKGNTFVGNMLTVKYQELTDGGIPRFPVGIAVRDYE